jgi:3-hydroxybutyryl-CoA dehydrogenase
MTKESWVRIAIIGTGAMGAGIAYVAALRGLDVWVHDLVPAALDAGLARIDKDLDDAERRGKLKAGEREAVRGRVHSARDLASCVGSADIVIEAVIEDLEVKQQVLRDVAAAAPVHALLATNTSALSITAIMSALDDPGRGIGMHFFNPVRAMPLCEIVVGLETRPETIDSAEQSAAALGKQTVRARDLAGFVTSRINIVIGNEAFLMLEQGVASAEDIDRAVRLALNHPMGPFQLADLVGLDIRLAATRELHRVLGDKYRPAPLLEQYVRAGRLGRKAGRGVYDYSQPAHSS